MEIVLGSVMFFTLIIAILSTYYAVKGSYGLYWISAISIYFFSLLMSFTIGIFTVSLAFVTLSLAIGYSFDWIKSRASLTFFLFTGAFIGVVIVYYVRDDLFYIF